MLTQALEMCIALGTGAALFGFGFRTGRKHRPTGSGILLHHAPHHTTRRGQRMINGPTFFESIRTELREERKRQHLTLREVADRMGTSLQYLNSLELGSRPNPGVRSLTAWSKALGGELLLDVDFQRRRR